MFAVKSLLAALSLTFSALVAAAEADSELLRQMLPSVIKVEARNTDGSLSIGSGIVLGSGLIVTNCHVTRNADTITLTYGDMRVEADSEASDVPHDVCLLHASAAQFRPAAAIARDSPEPGQAVFAVGFSGGRKIHVSDGLIDALHDFDGGKLIETSAPFAYGASGGGLFDVHGQLVGILSFKSRGAGARHYCLPAAWVVMAARHFEGRPVAPLNGLPFWQESSEKRPDFLRNTEGADLAKD
jgi:serine protease Do